MPLAPLTTLHVGPTASIVFYCDDIDQIITATTGLDRNQDSKTLILGGGSNVVIADDLADLAVIKLNASNITIEGTLLRAQAGALWDQVVKTSLQAGLVGLECLSGIPGCLGGAVVGNIGAYGVEIATYIRRVYLLDRQRGTTLWVDGKDLEFGYRTSSLKNSSDKVVLEVEFALQSSPLSVPLAYQELADTLKVSLGDRVDPYRLRAAVLQLRATKGMVLDPADPDTYSVGSFFTNPTVSQQDYNNIVTQWNSHKNPQKIIPHWPGNKGVKLAAGWLIEQAGFLRGYPGPDAVCRLSTKHALAITNRGSARSADVLALAREIRQGVHRKFGITLTCEPVLIGCSL